MRQNENQYEIGFGILFIASMVFSIGYLLFTGETHRFLVAGILFGTFTSLFYLLFQELKYKREWRLVRNYPKVLFYGKAYMVIDKQDYLGLLLLFDRSLVFLSPWDWNLCKKPFKTIKYSFPFENILEIHEEKKDGKHGYFSITNRDGKVYCCFLKNREEWFHLIEEKAKAYNEAQISDTDRKFQSLRPFSKSFGTFTPEQYEIIRNQKI